LKTKKLRGIHTKGRFKLYSDLINFYSIQRQIFGICPCCNDFFRLNDCKIYIKKKPPLDWMDKIDIENDRLKRSKERLLEMEDKIREKARLEGRRLANRILRKIDPVFTPRKLNPDDAKVIFHPIDYIVFNGMKKNKSIKNIILLDRQTKKGEEKKIQKSVEKVIEKENYEWQTLRIQENSEIKTE